MTANITQNVIRRQSVRSNAFTSRPSVKTQRGSINPAALTISFGLLALLVVGLLGFFYLQQVVQTTSQGTDVRTLENKIIELQEQQRQLELSGAELRSLQAIEDRIDKLNLVTTDRVTYLAPAPGRMAALAD